MSLNDYKPRGSSSFDLFASDTETGRILYLEIQGLSQGRGKIERFNRRIKEKVCLIVYCPPGELRKAIDEAIAIYNRTPHESLNHVSPNDVYAGGKEAILQRRKEKKRLTLERRKRYNLNTKNEDPDQHSGANSF